MLETDGPYCGNPCAATDHDHYDAADSVEMQVTLTRSPISILDPPSIYIYIYISMGHPSGMCLTQTVLQWRGQVEFYALMRQHGVYVHAPDGYLYAGGANKECGGYEENQMSLPRWQWLSIAHQENYDDTWTETPTQGWMFAPLQDCEWRRVPSS